MTLIISFFRKYFPFVAQSCVIITSIGGLILYKFQAHERRFEAHERRFESFERRMEKVEDRIDQAYQVLILHVVGEKDSTRKEEK